MRWGTILPHQQYVSLDTLKGLGLKYYLIGSHRGQTFYESQKGGPVALAQPCCTHGQDERGLAKEYGLPNVETAHQLADLTDAIAKALKAEKVLRVTGKQLFQ